MLRLIRGSLSRFSRTKWSDAFKQFLEHDAGSSIRREVHHKDRKYVHIEITEQFKRQEQDRKKQRLEHVKARKRLLQQKLTLESKLLGSPESQQITHEISTLQELLQQQEKELALLEDRLEETEARLVLMEGARKLVVLNKIEYLKHMNMHPSGLVLQPQVIKMIENIHYLVNNNLPVDKFKLYEIMPELFETEINELQDSIKKLIEEKKLDPESDPSGRIRFFVRHKTRFRDPEQDIIDIQNQRQAIFQNMQREIVRLLQPHESYTRLVQQGLTPFRNIDHMMAVMFSDCIKLNFNEEELAIRKALHEVAEIRNKFEAYSHQVDKKVVQMRHSYKEPPEYVKNHPLLMDHYNKVMVKYTNPQEWTASLGHHEWDDGGRAYLEEKLQNLVIEKYHPIIEKLWNEGRREELIASKKQLEIDFYNDSTRVYEEYQEMIAENKEKEEFLKIPKKPRQIDEESRPSITLDELTKSIAINQSNPEKYSIQFFTKFFGLKEEGETRKLFNSLSYLRVMPQQEKSIDTLKFQIIKFREGFN